MTRTPKPNRSGKVLVFTALCLTILLGMTALAIDLGILCLARTQLQAASDSGSLSGGTELLSGLGAAKTRTPDEVTVVCRNIAADYVALHPAAEVGSINLNTDEDVRFGTASLDTETGVWSFNWGTSPYNAIGVSTHRTAGSGNGAIPLLFAKALGRQTSEVSADSVAVIMPASGIRVPPGSGYSSGLTPFAFEKARWAKYWRAREHFEANGFSESDLTQANGGHLIPDPADLDESGNPKPLFHEKLINGQNGRIEYRRLFGDLYSVGDPDLQTADNILTPGDGILEMNIYPINNEAGNFGTVNIANDSNSTAILSDQIQNGLDEYDLSEYDNYTLDPSNENPLTLSGDTGISGGIEASLNEVIGTKRTILLYDTVADPGNNATYTITDMVGVRFMAVDLRGQDKVLIVQPDNVSDPTGIPNYEDEIGDETTFFTSLILAK